MSVYPGTSGLLQWHGRTMQDAEGGRQLISSASGVTFRFTGDKCVVWLKNDAPDDNYNYISIVLDGIHQERRAIHFDTLTPFEIKVAKQSPYHNVDLYKETEAVNGRIVVSRIETDSLLATTGLKRKKIEFIGNSITVGMASDTSLIPCMHGTWYDQHNAYDAYGPRAARALDLDYMVSGVSGIGIYRNWNTDGPTMGSVYEQSYMDGNPAGPQWDFKQFTPDILTICLGTNDLSRGDGVTPRLPFDSIQFINAYVLFLEKINALYPDALIVLLNSPVTGGDNEILNACLQAVKEKAEKTINQIKPVSVFTFKIFEGTGCDGHPDVEQHRMMAEELIPVIRKLL